MTECIQSRFAFEACGKREIVAQFDGGTISSDGGVLLLRQTEKRLNLLARLAECFLDGRDQAQVEHSIEEMFSQRVYGLALSYEVINDHEQLRNDPLFGVLAGKQQGIALAGKSTLNRFELGSGIPSRYKKITFWKESVDALLVKVYLECMASSENHCAGRFRLLPECVDELVRRQRRGLCIRLCPQQTATENHRRTDAPGN